MSFKTSEFSHLTARDHLTERDHYGYIKPALFVEVVDLEGTNFKVYADGTVELVRSGTTWEPGGPNYDLVVANLSLVRGNTEKMADIMGSAKVDRAISAGKAQQAQTPPEEVGADVPVSKKKLTDEWFFWPLVVGNTVAVVGGLIYYFRATDSGRRRWAKITRRNPSHSLSVRKVKPGQESGKEPAATIVLKVV